MSLAELSYQNLHQGRLGGGGGGGGAGLLYAGFAGGAGLLYAGFAGGAGLLYAGFAGGAGFDGAYCGCGPFAGGAGFGGAPKAAAATVTAATTVNFFIISKTPW